MTVGRVSCFLVVVVTVLEKEGLCHSSPTLADQQSVSEQRNGPPRYRPGPPLRSGPLASTRRHSFAQY